MRWTWLTGEGGWSWAEANQVGRVITPLEQSSEVRACWDPHPQQDCF